MFKISLNSDIGESFEITPSETMKELSVYHRCQCRLRIPCRRPDGHGQGCRLAKKNSVALGAHPKLPGCSGIRQKKNEPFLR